MLMMEPLILTRTPKYDREGGIRVVSPVNTLERTLPLLEKAGLKNPENITIKDNIGIPVYSISRPGAAEGTVSTHNGKGVTPEQAKASAVMEAMERYSAERRGDDYVVHGTYDQAVETGLTVDPVDLILPIDKVHYYRSAEIAWCRGWEMFRGEMIWVPACAVYHPYVPDGDLQLFRYNSNGLASGTPWKKRFFMLLSKLLKGMHGLWLKTDSLQKRI